MAPKKKTQPKVVQEPFHPSGSSTLNQLASESLFGSESENEEENRDNVNPPVNTTAHKPNRRWRDAGLLFPANKFHKMLIAGKYAKIIRKDAAVAIGGALEYMTSELLDIARDFAVASQKKRITPRHLMLAIRGDEEFDKLLSNITVPNSGVIPHIESVLLTTQKKRKRQMNDSAGPSETVAKKSKKLQPTEQSDNSD